ncbi:hypothetical protein Q8F55_002295 [Vanrija albida]|uniref:Uncharacterized protein n=1 Tax=Vanrija albida TaxID=181172 RepID=A0ABR3Q9E5_9TREE
MKSEVLLEMLLHLTPEMIATPGNMSLKRDDGMTLKTRNAMWNALYPKVVGPNPLLAVDLVATACALRILSLDWVKERGAPSAAVPNQLPDGSPSNGLKDLASRAAFSVVRRLTPNIAVPKPLCEGCHDDGVSACWILTTIDATNCIGCSWPEPTKTESTKTEPTNTEPTKTAPKKTEQKKTTKKQKRGRKAN